jgi:hypothetical protein
MPTPRFVFLLVVLALATVGSHSLAQRRTGARVVVLEPPTDASPVLPTPGVPRPASAKRPPAIGPYVLVGVLAGTGAVIGAFIYYYEKHPESECICGAGTFLIPIGGGAALGGIVGAIVYAVRHP